MVFSISTYKMAASTLFLSYRYLINTYLSVLLSNDIRYIYGWGFLYLTKILSTNPFVRVPYRMYRYGQTFNLVLNVWTPCWTPPAVRSSTGQSWDSRGPSPTRARICSTRSATSSSLPPWRRWVQPIRAHLNNATANQSNPSRWSINHKWALIRVGRR